MEKSLKNMDSWIYIINERSTADSLSGKGVYQNIKPFTANRMSLLDLLFGGGLERTGRWTYNMQFLVWPGSQNVCQTMNRLNI